MAKKPTPWKDLLINSFNDSDKRIGDRGQTNSQFSNTDPVHQNDRLRFNASNLTIEGYGKQFGQGRPDTYPDVQLGRAISRGAFYGQNSSGLNLGEEVLSRVAGITPGSGRGGSIDLQWGPVQITGNVAYTTPNKVYNFTTAQQAPDSTEIARRDYQMIASMKSSGARQASILQFDPHTFSTELYNKTLELTGEKINIGDVLKSETSFSKWINKSDSRYNASLHAYEKSYTGNNIDYDYSNNWNATESRLYSQVDRLVQARTNPTLGLSNIMPPSSLLPLPVYNKANPNRGNPTNKNLTGNVAFNSDNFYNDDTSGVALPSISRPPNTIEDDYIAPRISAPPRPGMTPTQTNITTRGLNSDSLEELSKDIPYDNSYDVPRSYGSPVEYNPAPLPIPNGPPPLRQTSIGMGIPPNLNPFPNISAASSSTTSGPPPLVRMPSNSGGGSNLPPTPPSFPPGFGPPNGPSGRQPKPVGDLSLFRISTAQGQSGSIDQVKTNLEDISNAFNNVGSSSKNAAKATEELIDKHKSYVSKIGDMYNSLTKTFETAEKIAGSPGGANTRAAAFLGQNTSLWANGQAQGSLAQMQDTLLGQQGINGIRGGGLYQNFISNQLGDNSSNVPNKTAFDRMNQFTSIASSAAWSYRVMRNIGKEFIEPLTEDLAAYQTYQSNTQQNLNRGGLVRSSSISGEQQQLLNYQNSRNVQQRSFGQAFQNAWLPTAQFATGFTGSGISETAAIGAPAIAGGLGSMYLAGTAATAIGAESALGLGIAGAVPAIGLGVAGLTAAAGIAGTAYSTLNNPVTTASLRYTSNIKSPATSLGQGISNFFQDPIGNAALSVDKWLNIVNGTYDKSKIANADVLSKTYQDVISGKQIALNDANYQNLHFKLFSENATNIEALRNIPEEQKSSVYAQTQRLLGSVPIESNQARYNQTMNSLYQAQLGGLDTNQIFNLPASKSGYGYMTDMISQNISKTNGNPALTANLFGTALGSAGLSQRLEQGYGITNPGDVINGLLGETTLYQSSDTKLQSAQYMFDTGLYQTTGNRAPGLTNRMTQNIIAGKGSLQDRLGIAMGRGMGANVNNPFEMSQYRSGAIDDINSNRGFLGQIEQYVTEQEYSGQYNTLARQYGLVNKGITPPDLTNYSPEQAQASFSTIQALGQLNTMGYGGYMSGTYNAAQKAINQKSSDYALNTQLTSQGITTGNMLQNLGNYNAITPRSMSFLDSLSQTQSGQYFSLMSGVLSGNPTANATYGDISGQEWRRTVQTGSRGGTAGMRAYYDETISSSAANSISAMGTSRGYIRGDGSYSVSQLSNMNQVQLESNINSEQIKTRNYDFNLAQKQLTRQQANITGIGLGSIVAGYEGKGSYYFEDQNRTVQRSEQDFSYQQQGKQLDLQRQQMQYGFAYQTQTMGIQRSHQQTEQGWGLQDLSYQRNMNSMQFGFSMIDADENIRYAHGKERRVLMRHRDEAVLTHSMEVGQENKEEERAKERIKWATDQYNLDKSHFEKEKQFEIQNFQIQEENYRKQIEFVVQQRGLEDQERVLRRAIAQIDMTEAQQSLTFHQMEKKTIDDLNGALKTQNDLVAQHSAMVANLKTQMDSMVASMGSGMISNLQNTISNVIHSNPILNGIANIGSNIATTMNTSHTNTTNTVAHIVYGSGSSQSNRSTNQMSGYTIPHGFAKGGYTGDELGVAGVVHGKEYVVPEKGALVFRDPEHIEYAKQTLGVLKQILAQGGNAMVMINDGNVKDMGKKALSMYDRVYAQ